VATVPGYGGGFSSDGRTAFVYDRDIAFLRARDGRKERRLPWPEPRRAAALSGDLSTLALVTEDGSRLDVWDVSRRPAARRWTVGASSGKQILEAVPSGDGRQALVLEGPQGPSHDWGVGPSIRYTWWRIGASSPSRVADVPASYGPFATSPDLGRVAMGAPDGRTVWVVSEATGRRQAMAEGHLTPLVQGLALSRDGTLVATGGDDKSVVVSDTATGKLVTRLVGHAGRTFMPAFSGDGRTVYSVSLDGSLIAWDLAGPRSLAEIHQAGAGNEDPNQWTIPAMDVSADGKLVAVAQLPSVVTVRRRDGLRVVRRLVMPAHVSTLDFSPDGRHLAVGDDKGGVAVFATDGWRRVAWIAAPPGLARGSTATAESVAFSPDGRTLGVAYRTNRAARGSTDGGGVIVRYVPSTGALAGPTIDAQAPAIALAWAPDGKAVAAVLDEFDPDVKPLLPPDGSLASWSLNDRKRLFLVDVDGVGHGRPALGLTYSPDGALIAAGGGDGMLHLFRATDGKPVGRPLQTSAGWNVSSAFSPDGRRLASGGTDGTVRLFDLASRSAIGTPLQLLGWVTVRFTPDGRTLVGASSPGGVAFLDVDPASWQRRACRLAGRTLTRDEWAQFMPGHAYAPACR
jgi:WD40 repeat protein